MGKDRLEGWAYPVSETVGVLKIMDHTFVKAPDQGPAYFNCFGGHSGDGERKLKGASGKGNYKLANCYRLPSVLPDTAGLAPYSVHGVCHQAANRFLYSACGIFSGPTVSDAQFYFASFSLYGTYGRALQDPPPPAPVVPSPLPPADFVAIYAGCKLRTGFKAEAMPPGFDHEKAEGLESRIAGLHAAVFEGQLKLDSGELLQEQMRILSEERLGKDAPVQEILDWQSGLLRDVHGVATSDLQGEAFAHETNQHVAQSLEVLAVELGPEAYEKLTGTPAGEHYAVIDPRLAEIAAESAE